MRENKPSWFGHTIRRVETKVVIAVMKMKAEGKKEKENQKKMVGYD
jgi:hypothetical protein